MTHYSRGYAAALKAAADVCRKTGDTFGKCDHQTGAYVCQQKISRLPILGEATNPGEQVVRDAHTEDGSKHCVEPARPGPSQECVSDLSERLRQYADIADAGGKAHWANAMREAMYTLAVYRQNAAKEEHDAHR